MLHFARSSLTDYVIPIEKHSKFWADQTYTSSRGCIKPWRGYKRGNVSKLRDLKIQRVIQNAGLRPGVFCVVTTVCTPKTEVALRIIAHGLKFYEEHGARSNKAK